MTTLTPKQEAAAQAFVECGDKSEAYRRAYDAQNMKPETVNRTAFDLFENPKIAARVKELQERLLKKHAVTADRVLAEYAKLAFLDIRKAFDEDGRLKSIHDIDDETAAAISGLEVESLFEGRGQSKELIGRLHKIKLADKKGALDSLAKHLGMFVDRTEITGKDGAPLIPATKEQRDAAVAAAQSADA